jgi:hypothetical protein
MLESVGLLSLDTTIAALLRLIAFAVTWSSVAAGAWMPWRMQYDPRASNG